MCFLPDCFGVTPALPQLLRGAGIESFFTTKLNWSASGKRERVSTRMHLSEALSPTSR